MNGKTADDYQSDIKNAQTIEDFTTAFAGLRIARGFPTQTALAKDFHTSHTVIGNIETGHFNLVGWHRFCEILIHLGFLKEEIPSVIPSVISQQFEGREHHHHNNHGHAPYVELHPLEDDKVDWQHWTDLKLKQYHHLFEAGKSYLQSQVMATTAPDELKMKDWDFDAYLRDVLRKGVPYVTYKNDAEYNVIRSWVLLEIAHTIDVSKDNEVEFQKSVHHLLPDLKTDLMRAQHALYQTIDPQKDQEEDMAWQDNEWWLAYEREAPPPETDTLHPIFSPTHTPKKDKS